MVCANLILLNGKIATVDEQFAFVEAVAVVDGWIIDVGTTKEMNKYIGPQSKVIDLNGKLMLPGVHDAHMHGVHTGLALSTHFLDVSFPKVKSISDLQAVIETAVKNVPNGTWIMGMGWNEMLIKECMEEGRTPKKWDLDPVSPDHPVVINDYGAHRMVVNSKALEICGISSEIPDLKPEEGLIERIGDTKEPNGYLNEWGAQVLVWSYVPVLTEDEIESCILRMNKELNKYGITSHVDILGIGGNQLICGTWGEKSIAIYERLSREKKLTARVSVNLLAGLDGIQSYQTIIEGLRRTKLPKFRDRNWVKAETVKIFGDGGGWLRADNKIVEDHSRSTFPGTTNEEQEAEIIKTIIEVHRQGWQLGIHAIGGRTIDTIIKGYIQALQYYPREKPRHFIIHGDDMTLENAVDAGKFGIGMSVQSIAAHTIMDFMKMRFEQSRGEELFSWREYQEKGVNIANGSDSNIFSLNWLQGVQFAVTRKTINGYSYRSDLASSLEDAIRMYTLNGAKQEHLETVRGSIEIGKVADFQILDQDIFLVKPENIAEAKVLMTIVDGKIVYEK
ncbi:amidohydrolase [Enterococcus pallens]|uniref:Amidohydrolase 3 domain-containing protein n=1 Tax=Enterococcus pallens ATCC BAA-351 TaxID=1158607 RepID=R2QI46_9ENTE|nr:amidohydrolase [Enterococcus pallens]EOH96272.1 hypothetical protein UAU_00922 [Enterococcus pallens ATCC BAA-351]EOU14515.1 hypothetical protein I588_04872 [Enterococcus pallens ATCC BAA-351]OJG80994.1 hypothetical protein RV10_GL003993 [Enterococcus pallens]